MNKFSLSTVAVTTILGVTLFTGCGSSNSTPLDTTVSGQGLAAYINKGTAFIDCNKNGTQDTGELSVVTDATGNFSITGQVCADYDIVITSGRNSETGVSIPYPTIAPKGYTKVSPLTTMLAGLSSADQTSLLADLGITSDDLNTNYNEGSTNTTVQAKVAKLAAIKSYVETATTTSTSKADLAKVATSLKAAVATAKGSSTTVDFKDSTVLANLNTALVSNLNTAGVTTTTALSTALTNQVNTITTIANATTAAELTTAITTAENSNANTILTTTTSETSPAALNISKIEIGDQNVTLSGASFTKTIAKTSNISSFFDIKVTATPTKTFTEQTGTVTVKILDKNAPANTVTLSIAGVKVKAESTSSITTTIPEGSLVSVSQTGLSALATYIGDNQSQVTGTKLENTDLDVNVNTILNALGNTTNAWKIQEAIYTLGQYLNKAGNYTVTLEITDLDKTKLFIPKITGTIIVE